MTEVHRYKAVKLLSFGGSKIEYTPHGPDVVRAEDLDRVTAERDALQLLLNDLEEQNHSLEQRHQAEQQAGQAAEWRVEALCEFANEMVSAAFEGGSLDGADIQEIAVKHGLLRIETRQGECGERCACREYGFPAECYRRTELIALNHTAEAASHVDCGSCRNITDGCKGTCQRSEEWSKP